MYATSGSQIYKSTDGGTTFTNVTTGLPTGTITSVYVHPDSSNVALVTFSGFGAGRFTKRQTGHLRGLVLAVICRIHNKRCIDILSGCVNKYLLCCNGCGVFFTSNYGASWVELADGLPNTVAMHLDYHQQQIG
jgi:hypothetical protein